MWNGRFLFSKKRSLIFSYNEYSNRSDRLARHDRDVVIAHVVGRCAELDALVVVDVAVLRIAAEQDHHLDLFDLLADQGDELLQIPSLVGR